MRIAIVNDSRLAVHALERALAAAPEHSVAWVASDGAEAVALCERDHPDLILMDLLMPVMDGVEATRRIMLASPCAILVVTATVDGHCARVFEALGAGALDAVDTPELVSGRGAAALLGKIEILGKLMGERAVPVAVPRPAPGDRDALVTIGASAGGPAALAVVLGGLPRGLEAAVIVVQHVDAQFAPLLAAWLDERVAVGVRVARHGERPEAGAVLVAASDDHLAMARDGSLGYTPEPRELVYRPSIDVLFESVARFWRGPVTGVLLTGMGRDGARGLRALRDAGHPTIAQDRATSVVYGMPKAAAELGAAEEILPLERIATAVVRRLGTTARKDGTHE